MDRDRPTEMIPMPAVSEFEVVLRGYDRSQVREAMERLDADVRIALTDRDAAVARSSDLASQLSAVHAEMESLRRKLATSATPSYETMGERIAHMLRLAEEEGAEVRRNAHADATSVREQAQAIRDRNEAEQQQVAAGAERIRAKAERDAAAALTGAERQATKMVGDAEARRDAIVRQTEERHKRAEEDFEISLRERRREAARAEAERLAQSTGEADRRVAEADAEAQARVAAAGAQSEQMIAEAEQQRQTIAAIRLSALTQLREVRDLLAKLPVDTDPARPAVAGSTGQGARTESATPANPPSPPSPSPTSPSPTSASPTGGNTPSPNTPTERSPESGAESRTRPGRSARPSPDETRPTPIPGISPTIDSGGKLPGHGGVSTAPGPPVRG